MSEAKKTKKKQEISLAENLISAIAERAPEKVKALLASKADPNSRSEEERRLAINIALDAYSDLGLDLDLVSKRQEQEDRREQEKSKVSSKIGEDKVPGKQLKKVKVSGEQLKAKWKSSSNDILRMLVEAKADVNARYQSKEREEYLEEFEPYNPLSQAVAEGGPSVVKMLLKAKADPNQKNTKTGETLLHELARKPAGADELSMAEMLLAHKANVDLQNGERRTPLFYVRQQATKKQDSKDMVAGAKDMVSVEKPPASAMTELLEKHGAEDEGPGIDGCRPS